jgi:hypothetical protein
LIQYLFIIITFVVLSSFPLHVFGQDETKYVLKELKNFPLKIEIPEDWEVNETKEKLETTAPQENKIDIFLEIFDILKIPTFGFPIKDYLEFIEKEIKMYQDVEILDRAEIYVDKIKSPTIVYKYYDDEIFKRNILALEVIIPVNDNFYNIQAVTEEYKYDDYSHIFTHMINSIKIIHEDYLQGFNNTKNHYLKGFNKTIS